MSDNKPVINDEAVEAAAKLLWYSDSTLIDTERPDWSDAVANRIWSGIVEDTRHTAREILEAAAPILLSHERQLTADAHRDAIVNRDTVDRLERELENAKADAWDEGYQGCYDRYMYEPVPPNPYRSQA